MNKQARLDLSEAWEVLQAMQKENERLYDAAFSSEETRQVKISEVMKGAIVHIVQVDGDIKGVFFDDRKASIKANDVGGYVSSWLVEHIPQTEGTSLEIVRGSRVIFVLDGQTYSGTVQSIEYTGGKFNEELFNIVPDGWLSSIVVTREEIKTLAA